jgi:inhibitor of KinA
MLQKGWIFIYIHYPMNPYQPYSIFPLGDSALTIDFGNIISEDINKKVLRLFHQLTSAGDASIIDLVPTYSALTVYYDVGSFHKHTVTAFETMADKLEQLLSKAWDIPEKATNCFKIPVCYSKKFAIDIEYLSQKNQIPVEEIIHLHTKKSYKVYMLGFLPGFTYMGEVDERIAIARKPTPIKLFAGAVGIAGTQTGIYPLESPGGWQIIGRTPIKVFKKEDRNPVLFQPGDEIKFYPITEYEFENYQAGRT